MPARLRASFRVDAPARVASLWQHAGVSRPRGPVLLLAAMMATGCAGRNLKGPAWLDSRNAAAFAKKHPDSTVLDEANRLIEGMTKGDVAPIVAWMSPQMRDRYKNGKLERVSKLIQKRYGRALGIVEERVHTEASLRWYSGLVVYGAEDDELSMVLYQFAMDQQGALTRLLIREHPFRNELRHPAEEYRCVNRFDFMSSGTWTVVHGGRLLETNKHHNSVTQRYAYDLVVKKGNSWGRGARSRNSDFYGYGRPLYAPAPGRVIFVRDGVPENRPQSMGKGGGNGVIIDHGFGEYSQLWHMVPGSVLVKKGDWVQWGQPLGKVGNSGRSTAPHIHFHVESAAPKKGGIALPAEFADVEVNGKYESRSMPKRDQRVERRNNTGDMAQRGVLLNI